MRFAVLLLLAGLLAAPALSAQHPVPSEGQWLIEPGEHADVVRLTIRYGEGRHSNSWNSQDSLPSSQLAGLARADMTGSGAAVHFKIVRSAGTLTCEGWFENGRGSGHFTYQPNPEFVAELAKRGIDAPTAWEQFEMTMARVGLDLVDELQRQGYDRPTARVLARMGRTVRASGTSGTSEHGDTTWVTPRAWSACAITGWTPSSSSRWTAPALRTWRPRTS